MPTLRVTLEVEEDNKPLPGFPLMRRVVVGEAINLAFKQVTGAPFVTVPGIPSAMSAMQAILLTADQAVAVRFNNNSNIALNTGGIILILDANIAAAPYAEVQNNSGSTANLNALVAGT